MIGLPQTIPTAAQPMVITFTAPLFFAPTRSSPGWASAARVLLSW